MEEIAGYHDRVGARGEYAIHRLAEGHGGVGLALIDASGGLPMVLPEAEMQVGEVRDFHR